jgi:hypothetical protein
VRPTKDCRVSPLPQGSVDEGQLQRIYRVERSGGAPRVGKWCVRAGRRGIVQAHQCNAPSLRELGAGRGSIILACRGDSVVSDVWRSAAQLTELHATCHSHTALDRQQQTYTLSDTNCTVPKLSSYVYSVVWVNLPAGGGLKTLVPCVTLSKCCPLFQIKTVPDGVQRIQSKDSIRTNQCNRNLSPGIQARMQGESIAARFRF